MKGERSAGQTVGPGSVRVGRFIGRLGVVSLPVVSVGLGLAERVVRRHASRLQELGWLGRVAGLRGEGSIVWLTALGLEGVGLERLQAPRAPNPFAVSTFHSVRIGVSAARLEHRGFEWRSARELALEPERWSIAIRNERGGISHRLPDLALTVGAPESLLAVAVVIEDAFKREQRHRIVLEGCQAAINSQQYAQVQYDCSSPELASRLTQIATQISLASPQFRAVAQTPLEQITQLAPAEPDAPAPTAPQRPPQPATDPPTPPAAANVDLTPSLAQEPVETPMRDADRQQQINELHEIPETKPRRWRPWRR